MAAEVRNIPEILLHYIWQKGLFLSSVQTLTDGTPVEVLSVGRHNTDAGPDFSDVHLRIGDREWVGNVEMHIHSSDWYRHRHHLDSAYDNIILHVVREADKLVYNSSGELIPQCVLNYPLNDDYLSKMFNDAMQMDSAFYTHRCAHRLLNEPSLLTQGWKHTLLINRLECKKASIDRLLNITHGNWEQAFYITLAHSFGFHTNGIPFEMLAINTPLSYLLKHRNSLFQLTAIVLGQSGLLDEATQPKLWKEYSFLQHKFSLQPIEGHLWKHSRLRPQNSPELRISQFAALIHQSEGLLSQLMDTSELDKLEYLLQIHPEENATFPYPAKLGKDSVNVLIINVVAPFLYARGKQHEALQLLENMPAENNSVIRQWRTLGQAAVSAADTQALIQLYTVYCQAEKCINCDVAYQIFVK